MCKLVGHEFSQLCRHVPACLPGHPVVVVLPAMFTRRRCGSNVVCAGNESSLGLLGSEYLPRALVRQLDGGKGRERKVLLAAEKKVREEKRKEKKMY